MNKDNNNKILEKYLPKAIPISILALIILSITIFIITYLINGFTHLNLFSLVPILFILNIHFDSKENREKYINLVRSQEEHFSVKFSDVGVERIGNTVRISYDWIITSEYALYKDYVSDVSFEEKTEKLSIKVRKTIIEPTVKVNVYYITIKTLDNTEYKFCVNERYFAERIMTWFERKKHERNK